MAVAAAEGEDSWTAADKFYHLIFCFTLTLLFSLLIVVHTRHRILRRHSTVIAASFSLLAGAAKEFADHLGFFHSSGASARDAVADVAGVVIACWGKHVTWPDFGVEYVYDCNYED
ncbi:hypothetical protein vseg_012953 [Gypsophila vaccaria]